MYFLITILLRRNLGYAEVFGQERKDEKKRNDSALRLLIE